MSNTAESEEDYYEFDSENENEYIGDEQEGGVNPLSTLAGHIGNRMMQTKLGQAFNSKLDAAGEKFGKVAENIGTSKTAKRIAKAFGYNDPDPDTKKDFQQDINANPNTQEHEASAADAKDDSSIHKNFIERLAPPPNIQYPEELKIGFKLYLDDSENIKSAHYVTFDNETGNEKESINLGITEFNPDKIKDIMIPPEFFTENLKTETEGFEIKPKSQV